jgi:hypothetical protein
MNVNHPILSRCRVPASTLTPILKNQNGIVTLRNNLIKYTQSVRDGTFR